MKEAFWGYFIVALGVMIIAILLFTQRLTSTNEEDFYLTREVLEASMLDAVDEGSYRSSGRIIMSREKFEEVFIRRFAESVTSNKNYTIEFYDIVEEPPKVTLRIRTDSGTTTINSDSFGTSIDTLLSGIIEDKNNTSIHEVMEYLISDVKTNCIEDDWDYAFEYASNTIPKGEREDYIKLLNEIKEGKDSSCPSGVHSNPNIGAYKPLVIE